MTAAPTGGMDADGTASATEGSNSNSNSNSNSGTETTVDPSLPADGTADSGGPPKFDVDSIPDAGVNCGSGGMVDESYIWIPSTSDGYVAKINTRTMTEEARYLTGPSGGGEDVSRTAVSIDGRFVIVNARGTGRSTVVAANVADCKDTNADGMITTSTSAADVKPWGTDECVLWNVVHPAFDGNQTHGPRGVSWTPGDYNAGTCTYSNQKIWLGYQGGNDAHLIRLDGLTGVQEIDLLAGSWNGSGYAPYGGALDPQLRPWFTGLRGELARVDTNANPPTVTRISQPGEIQSYGMTVDPNGNPWMGGCSGPVSTYDVATNQWISVAGTGACHRGMAVDHNFHVWVASNGPCGLVEVDGPSRTLVAMHNLAQCSTPIGVSVDVDGYVWLVDQEGWAWKIDPANPAGMQMMIVPGSHYVYSDMTGGQLKSVAPPAG
ncbi:MAG: lyase [Myxococcales bacterium]|nr:lyase [Myxococcales bacterium]